MPALKRSPVLDTYTAAGFSVVEQNGMSIAAGGEAIAADSNTLVDISALAKYLVVGVNAAAWLATRGIAVADALFSCAGDAGQHCIRIHNAQYLLLMGTADNDELWQQQIACQDGVMVMPYECAEFALVGPCCHPLLKELSTFDPMAVVAGRWFAMRIAHAEVGLRVIDTPSPHWRISCSPADAHYLFELLHSVVCDHGGGLSTFDRYMAFIDHPDALA